jgi:hypothetical protein
MNILKRIGEPTPKKNRIIGQITTALATASLIVAESGVIDNRPLLKLTLQVLSAKLGAVSVYQAQKTIKDGPTNN